MDLKSEIKRETNEKSEKKSEKISKSIQKKCHILQIDGTRFQFTPPLLLCLLLFFVCYVFSQFEASAICTRTRVYICINTRRVLGKNVFSFFPFPKLSNIIIVIALIFSQKRRKREKETDKKRREEKDKTKKKNVRNQNEENEVKENKASHST